MGNRQRLRKAFFSSHPFCCFCGGAEPAPEEDHIPARHLFRGRQWPEGYVFPACAPCNAASAVDELVMGWLVRVAISDLSSEDEHELQLALAKLYDRKPHWVRAIKEMSRTDTRRSLREVGLHAASFKALTSSEIYMVQLPEEMLKVPVRYGEKLARALYYKHSGKVLAADASIRVRVAPNSEYMSPTFPYEDFEVLSARPALARSGKSLDDQFSYRYGAASDGPAAGFMMRFGESMLIVALVYEPRLGPPSDVDEAAQSG